MKKIYNIILIYFLAITFAQNINVKGIIKDKSSNENLKGAIIFVNNCYFYSDSDGKFKFAVDKSELKSVKISHIGYKSENLDISNINRSEVIVFLEPTLVELDDILVTSNKSEKYLRYTTGSEALIDIKDIQVKPYQSLADILKNEAGISILRDGVWGTDLNIRGMSRQNIVTLIDGSRIETSNDLAARLSMIDLNDIEKVEVIKGAASSVYGSGATGGIVNIVSKMPSFSENNKLNFNINSGFNSVNNLISTSGNLLAGNDIVALKISGSYRKANNIETPVGELKNSQFKDYSFSGNVNIKPVEDHLLRLQYQQFKAEDVGIPGATLLFPATADVRYPVEKRNMFLASYEINNISKLLKKVVLTYTNQYILRDVENIPYTVQNLPAGNGQPARRVSVLKITPGAEHKFNSLQLLSSLTPSENYILTAGIDLWSRKYEGKREKYQKIEILNNQNQITKTVNKIVGEKPLPNSQFDNLGVFIQNDYEAVKSKLFLTFGARIDKINITGEETKNPEYEITDGIKTLTPAGQKIIWQKSDAEEYSYSTNLGILYSILENTDLSFNAGYSFRAPSLEERFQYIDQGSLIRLGKPDLKSEKGIFLDLGLRYYSNNFKVKTSIFFNYMKDMVIEENGTFEGRPAKIKTNVGKANLYGFDISANYSFSNSLLVNGNLSYVYGRDIKEDKFLPEIPPLNGSVKIQYFLNNIIEIGISTVVFAEQKNIAQGEVETLGYAVFGIFLNSGNISFSTINFRLYSGVENLFNKNYRNHLSTARGSFSIEPGRNFYLKLSIGI